ncbi:MAG TPA: hypothetical protein VFA26_25935, partial [Gemmataceae bacterium]|nr:hypothetical protein [Gemmataceae bacterium]
MSRQRRQRRTSRKPPAFRFRAVLEVLLLEERNAPTPITSAVQPVPPIQSPSLTPLRWPSSRHPWHPKPPAFWGYPEKIGVCFL